ncbi:MAG TPA: hypothetical protein VG096_21970 [Bryobacteraceae bacterium]|jgi:hypothetical protein|nr:hypothetical protein [Bryobacteraceae bacterium]
MKPGPSKKLETMVGLLLPPACREHVLGDLWERYRGNWQYLREALRILPMLLVSRIRRTVDPQLLLIEGFATYLSFLAAGWQFYGSSFLYGQSGFLRLAAPALAAIVSLLVFDAYFERVGPLGNAAAAVGAGLSFQILVAGLIARLHLSMGVLVAGGVSSVLLVSGLRIVLTPGGLRRLQQSIEGPSVDPQRMSAEEIRTAALRMYRRARAARLLLWVGIWPPMTAWVSAMWRSPTLLVTLGCALSFAGWVYGLYKMQKAFTRGRLDRDPSLAMCLAFCRANLEGRLELLSCVWPRILGPLLAGPLTVLSAVPSINVFWRRIPLLVLVTLFFLAAAWFARRSVPRFQRQIDALDEAQKQA